MIDLDEFVPGLAAGIVVAALCGAALMFAGILILLAPFMDGILQWLSEPVNMILTGALMTLPLAAVLIGAKVKRIGAKVKRIGAKVKR